MTFASVVVLIVAGLAAVLWPGSPRAGSLGPTAPPGPGMGGASPAPAVAASAAPVASTPDPTVAPAESAAPSPGVDAGPTGVPTMIVPGQVGRASLDLLATYDADLRLGFDSRRFDVNETVVVTNSSGGPIDRVELNTAAAPLGGLRLDATRVDGRAVQGRVDDQTIVVPLGGILPHGASARIEVAFRSTLRSGVSGSDWMFTRSNGVIDAYRWLPWVSRPHPFARPNHGDPFVTPVSPRVRVRITTDRALVLATTGVRTGVDGLTQSFEALNVRDFMLAAAPDYRVGTATAGETTIQAFTRPGGLPASTLLSEARKALLAYSERLGPYPYSVFNVAQTAGGYAVEAPGLIWIPTSDANLSYVVHHETAHQWFYGIVGSDQATEPFADEGPADFVARFVLNSRRASRCATAPLDRSIYQYSATCFYEIVYIQGGALLDDARKRMGETAFWDALRDYVAANRFGMAGTRVLLDALQARSSVDLVGRYASRFPNLP
jgi:hypothetical protein